MNMVTLGIDLAKNIAASLGVDQSGRAILVKPRVRRDQPAALIASLPPCLIGMVACTGAHHGPGCFKDTAKLSASWPSGGSPPTA
jgi:transposase